LFTLGGVVAAVFFEVAAEEAVTATVMVTSVVAVPVVSKVVL